MPTPIFVLGTQRSGTTDLANRLSEHPEIAGLRHPKHFGTLESAYFSHIYGRYGDLRQRSNFVEFAEVMAASDYFALACADREFLYSLWPTSYETVFRATMDRYADSVSAGYWLEKSPMHSRYVREIAGFYPDAKFIFIQRDLHAVITSMLRMPGKDQDDDGPPIPRGHTLLWGVYVWVYYRRLIHSFPQRSRVHFVRFEDMRRDTEETIGDVCAFLGVPFEPEMLGERFQRDTSFKSDVERARVLSPADKRTIAIARLLFQGMPLPLLSLNYQAKRVLNRQQPLPYWFFRVTRPV